MIFADFFAKFAQIRLPIMPQPAISRDHELNAFLQIGDVRCNYKSVLSDFASLALARDDMDSVLEPHHIA